MQTYVLASSVLIPMLLAQIAEADPPRGDAHAVVTIVSVAVTPPTIRRLDEAVVRVRIANRGRVASGPFRIVVRAIKLGSNANIPVGDGVDWEPLKPGEERDHTFQRPYDRGWERDKQKGAWEINAFLARDVGKGGNPADDLDVGTWVKKFVVE